MEFNPDGMGRDDLEKLSLKIRLRGITAKELFGLEFQPSSRIGNHALQMAKQYIDFSIRARDERLIGRIAIALQYEGYADRIYKQLPEWAKW